MKKIIVLIFMMLVVISSCNKTEEKYKVYYNVYYPNNTKNYTIIIDDTPYLGSDRGTNYLKVGSITGPTIIRTSAPIELVQTVKLKEK